MKLFKCIFFWLLMMLMLNAAHAQQKHFIYIQSADKQPFAVVLNGKVYSSSDYGYVIVPKLVDGAYNFTVSFPMNKFPDQKFDCVIDKKDLGYTLKNTGNSWTLLSAQKDNSVANNSNTNPANTLNTNAPAKNAFGDMLSQVANDSNLATKNQAAANKVDTTTAAANNIVINNSSINNVDVTANTNTPTVAPATTNAALQKLSEEKQDTGTRMVFVDNADTIKVFVPSTAVASYTTSTTNIDTIVQQNAMSSATSSINIDTSKHDASNPFYNQSSTQNNTTNQSQIAANTTTNSTYNSYTPDVKNDSAAKTSGAVKSDCNYTLTDNDIDKIKRKMFVQKNDNGMVQAAVKFLGDRCITTEQVKLLGNLFSSDDGRYNLYDALYKNAYDYGNYATLETQILDPYYKRRFETMIR